MRILSKVPFTAIQPLLQENYANLYSRLSLKLPPQAASCLAKFTMLAGQNAGQWSVDCEGENEYKPLGMASADDRQKIALAMRSLADALRRLNLGYDINRLLAVPDDNCIFYRIMPDGSAAVVLSQWGFRSIGGGKPVDAIAIADPFAGGGANFSDVSLKLQWSDDTPIVETKVSVGVYGTVSSHLSTDAGMVTLGPIANGELLTIDVDGQDTVTMRTDGSRSEYPIVYPWRVGATVRCVNAAHKPIKATIDVNGNSMESDVDGLVIVEGIELTKGRKLTVSRNGGNQQEYQLHRDTKNNEFEYILADIPVVPEIPQIPETPVEEPIEEEMASDIFIHVVDKKNRPMAFARVRLKLEKGIKDMVTDSQGYIKVEREAFTQGEKVKLTVLPGAAAGAVATGKKSELPPIPNQK